MTVEQVVERARDIVEPTSDVRLRVDEAVTRFVDRCRDATSAVEPGASVFLAGSVSKDTYLPRDVDLDIFVRFPPTLDREEFEEKGLEIAAETLQGLQVRERYAEHPFLEADYDGITVSVVPSYETDFPDWKSATDRTYHHVEYVKGEMSTDQKTEVRLLKAFTKAIGVYGAEVRVRGFSGYLEELLILHTGSFLSLVREAARWSPPISVDLADRYEDERYLVEELFDDPLVVVDPVDRSRNVASPVSKQSLARFCSACRGFLRKPEERYFEEERTWDHRELSEDHLSHTVVILLEHGQKVEDVHYPQLEKLANNLENILEQNGFTVADTGSYTDNDSISCIVLLMESVEIPKFFRHSGPSAFSADSERPFVESNLDVSLRTWISQEGRWMSLRRRKKPRSEDVIRRVFDRGKAVPQGLTDDEYFGFSINVGKDLTDLYETNDFAKNAISEFFAFREFWMAP